MSHNCLKFLYCNCFFDSICLGGIQNDWAMTWQNQQCGCAPSEDSDQPGHPPSLISLHCPHEESSSLCYPLSTQQRLWSDWADAQADLCLHWVHSHFVGFVMSQLSFVFILVEELDLVCAIKTFKKNFYAPKIQLKISAYNCFKWNCT